jgi:hypothetical protein
MKPLIIWEKWIDPFGKDHEEIKWNDYDKEDEEDMYNDVIDKRINKNVKVIQSPMGLIPYNEHTAPSKIFNFWIGHTNFNVSKSIINILENSNGVEILDIFTRYRFRIAVGKCFNDSEIMTEINTQIYNFLDQ